MINSRACNHTQVDFWEFENSDEITQNGPQKGIIFKTVTSIGELPDILQEQRKIRGKNLKGNDHPLLTAQPIVYGLGFLVPTWGTPNSCL